MNWGEGLTTRQLADILATACRNCGAKFGKQCTTMAGEMCPPHVVRRLDAQEWRVK